MDPDERRHVGPGSLVPKGLMISTPLFLALTFILQTWLGWGLALAIGLVLSVAVTIPLSLAARRRNLRQGPP